MYFMIIKYLWQKWLRDRGGTIKHIIIIKVFIKKTNMNLNTIIFIFITFKTLISTNYVKKAEFKKIIFEGKIK